MTPINIETRIDGMAGRAIDEIHSFIDSEAVRNPVMNLVGADFVVFSLAVPILFGLLCISMICRECEARRS